MPSQRSSAGLLYSQATINDCYMGISCYLNIFLFSDFDLKVAETDVEVPFSPFQHGATMTEYDLKTCADS